MRPGRVAEETKGGMVRQTHHDIVILSLSKDGQGRRVDLCNFIIAFTEGLILIMILLFRGRASGCLWAIKHV